jgi:3'-phosphoadenosine 5'-phosphosulfate (PAPS) 3'-phosphatase
MKALLKICRESCEVISPIVFSVYSSMNADLKSLKKDNSAFTIADGLVQYLLVSELFKHHFNNIIDEEDESIVTFDDDSGNVTVDALIVPTSIAKLVGSIKSKLTLLSHDINKDIYKNVTVFVDPIDGTKEFVNRRGEQCSICIGFSNSTTGNLLGGIVYRPITGEWAAGAVDEGYVDGNQIINERSTEEPPIFLTSSTSTSPYILELIKKLDGIKYAVGGAGNKILLLLENKGTVYIRYISLVYT